MTKCGLRAVVGEIIPGWLVKCLARGGRDDPVVVSFTSSGVVHPRMSTSSRGLGMPVGQADMAFMASIRSGDAAVTRRQGWSNTTRPLGSSPFGL